VQGTYDWHQNCGRDLEDRMASRLSNRASLQQSSARPSICNLDLLLPEATISVRANAEEPLPG
jgi:hypothetical protein